MFCQGLQQRAVLEKLLKNAFFYINFNLKSSILLKSLVMSEDFTRIKSPSDLRIEDYLKDKYKTLKGTKGKCRTCERDVPWNREKVCSHKRGNCPGANKDFWLGNMG